MTRLLVLFVVLIVLVFPVAAQDDVPVPDVTGMSVPQAAAIFNLVGLNLGTESPVDPQPGQSTNTIAAQSVAAGSTAPRGAAVDVSVILPPNMRLIYDDNDITIINLTDGDMNLGGVGFRSTGDGAASFAPSQVAGVIDADDCIQVWSVIRNEPKGIEGCRSLLWRSTRNTAVHFWTQVNNVQSFSVTDNGVERALCPAAPPNSQNSPITCEAYISGGGSAASGDVAPFIYLAYTADAIAFINPTQNQWMLTNQTTLVNNNPNLPTPGTTLVFGDPNLLSEEFRVGVGDVTRLAPQQCIMFTATDTSVGESPESCFVIAQRPLDDNTAFWRAEFVVRSGSDGEERTCPAATSTNVALCIVPY
jgi:hypothetical protein